MKTQEYRGKDRQFAVLGLGHFGDSIARSLINYGYDVLAFDIDEDRVHDAASYATYAVQGDLTDEADMSALGISNFEVVVIAVGTDFEAAVIGTMIAKEQGCRFVLVKATGSRQKKILESVGANRVVLPEIEMGERVAANLVSNNILDYINISEDYSIAEISPKLEWVGKSILKSNIREDAHLNVIAIKSGTEIIVSPKPKYIINANDVLVVVGSTTDISNATTE